jgi:NADH-ubiquinone oxidoreductase chain 2
MFIGSLPMRNTYKDNNKLLSLLNKTGEQFKIIEYPLIILFIITGGTFLMASSDLISIFLSI